jgi:hypothetical protein
MKHELEHFHLSFIVDLDVIWISDFQFDIVILSVDSTSFSFTELSSAVMVLSTVVSVVSVLVSAAFSLPF